MKRLILRIVLPLLLAALFAGCASLPPHVALENTHAITDMAVTPLGGMAERSAPQPNPDKLSGFRLLPEASFSLDARIALAQRAQKTLDVQYYLLEKDEVGLRLLRELRDAAARGVRVRLLVDDLYAGSEDELFSSLAAHQNIEVRAFNPLPARGGSVISRVLRSAHEFARINHRMHNKLFVADNSFSVSGGRNIAADYFMRNEVSNFIDVDVLSAGEAVRAQSEGFDRYWNSTLVRPIHQLSGSVTPGAQAKDHFEKLSNGALAAIQTRPHDLLGRAPVSIELDRERMDLAWAPAQVLVDSPEKITRSSFEERLAGSVTEKTLATIHAADHKVVIASPYFIPGDIGMGIIRAAAGRGVSTTLITNSLGATDEPLVYAGYARYRNDMLKLGVVIYEIGPMLSRRSRSLGDFGKSTGRLHAKMAVIDGRRIFIGSMNLDGRSASLNTETGLLIDSTALVDDFNRLIAADRFSSAYQLRLTPRGRVEWVERDVDGQQTVHETEPHTNWLTEIKNWLISPFVREELL